MIDCTEYRRRITAEPALAAAATPEAGAGADAELPAHRSACAGCAAYADRLLAFESRLSAALRIDLPAVPERTNVIPFAPRKATGAAAPAPKRRLAIAASIVLGIGIATALWLGTAESSLAADVVDHMDHEPDAWRVTAAPVPEAQLAEVLRDAHVRLLPQMGRVSYAMSCSFRHHHVPHLVVQTPKGPVTVMVLAHENVSRPEHFDEQGYRGMIVPVPGHGSVAVITRGASMPDTERVVAQLLPAIQWTP